MLESRFSRHRAALVWFALASVPSLASAQNLIVNGNTVSLSGLQRFDHICVINGGVINVTPYSGSGSKAATGNLELIARTIYVSENSRIDARGAGYSTTRCSNGRGPTGSAGGRGGCSVNDSGGGGAHFGLAGRGTIDAPTQYPRDFEDNCMQTWTGSACSGRTCPGFCGSNGCYPNTTGPTVAGQPYWHNIYDPEFGASGGDKGCRDGDGTTGPTTVGGPGGGRVVLVGLDARGTGNAPSACVMAAMAAGHSGIPNGSVILDGDIDAGGKRGCGYENDSGGGGGGGTVLVVGGLVRVGANSQVSAAGGLGGDTLAGAPASPNSSDCPSGSQNSGTCDDCGGGGGGGIISVLSLVSEFNAEADFYVGGGQGGTCGPLACIGESGGGAGELQLDGAYVGEYCDGFDNDFDGMIDEGLGQTSCGLGSCATTIQSCAAGSPPACLPATTNANCLAPATDTRPRVSVILDTSASMLLDLDARPTFGDGSSDQPSRAGAQQSRMQLARESLAQVMSAYPEIDFSLARYHQDQGLDRSCQSAAWFECQGLVASYDNPTGNTGAVACTGLPVSGPSPSGVQNISVNVDANGDECINYAGSCGAPRRGADVLTGFGMATNHIVRWIDGSETADDITLSMITPGNVCNHSGGGDCEVRGSGPTPLAGSLQAIQDYVVPIRATDPVRQGNNICRSYDVILVTDGEESCNGDPVAAAAALLSQGIQTHVIGLDVPNQAPLNAIAAAGGTGMAAFVDAPAQFVPVLTSIIADSILSETCNGMDDDCDGSVDEDFPGLGDACNNGMQGVCRATGTVVCTTATTTGCMTGNAMTPGVESCTGLGDAACDALCNGLDDDCDGSVDEDLVRACDRGCGEGTEFCSDDAWVGCGARSPSPEICNNFDDDCDGEIDEGDNGEPITRPCATACGPGVETCINGEYPLTGPGSCTAPGSSMEICNNLDDNCNGIIDDGNPGGGERCIPRDDGGYDVVDPTMIDPSEELCNPGTVTCSAGQLRCVGSSSRSPEICNCSDDDCDGMIDEEASDTLCPGNSVCITTPASGSTPMACFCASPCAESEFGACPPGRFCDMSYADDTIRGLCLRGLCEGKTCPDTAVCEPATGECVDLCADVTCGGDRTCVRGRCVEDNCYGKGCPSGQICAGECITDPCVGVRCEDDEFCRASDEDPATGICIGACGACEGTQVCRDGACVDDPCDGGCSSMEACVDGECVANSCIPVCGTNRVCHGGTCVHNPCTTNEACPTGSVCVAVDEAGTLVAQCEAAQSEVDAGVTQKNVLAAGGGGCTCSVPGAPANDRNSSGALIGIGLLCALFVLRRRVALRSKTMAATVVAVVASASVVGCTVDPFCVENCEGTVAGTSAGTSAGGTGGTGGSTPDSGPMRVDANLDGCIPDLEICNGQDDDCDNAVDETFALQTDPANCGGCDTRCVIPNAFAACVAGECTIDACEAGFHNRDPSITNGCEYECTESGAEVCDGRDNDCDLETDEATDLQTDLGNCGVCGNACNYPNAAGSCVEGACVMGECVSGFENLNQQVDDGCELRCTRTVESCNGLDDDCDGRVDETLTPPTFCRNVSSTPCAGTVATCRAGDSGTTWYCDYPTTVDFSPSLPNGLAADEARCDGVDNDCDGEVDESFGDVGVPCNDGLVGACRGTGTIRCASLQTTECNITSTGATPGNETCNGIDDDCDGRVDEGSIDDVVHITHSNMDFWVYRYEASRTDAATNAQGSSTSRACSKSGVLPWTNVSRDAAEAACVAAGMRLCTTNEWRTACEGTADRLYPYGAAYDDDACNGADYGSLPAQGGLQRVRATGSVATCASQDGIRDMSGNVKEWTRQTVGSNYVVRGGSYASPELGLTCLTTLSESAGATVLPGTGFRCCSPTMPVAP